MGWSIGFDSEWERDIGYGVPCKCDHPGCEEQINRGLDFVCGSDPKGGEHGCGLYFCSKHLSFDFDEPEENERSWKALCSRCVDPDSLPFDPKPDIKEWLDFKRTDESWREWRVSNPKESISLNISHLVWFTKNHFKKFNKAYGWTFLAVLLISLLLVVNKGVLA